MRTHPAYRNPDGGDALAVLIIATFIVALLVSAVGCAHGSDGVRQGCASTADAVGGGYKLLGGWIQVDQAAIREIGRTDKVAGELAFIKHQRTATRLLVALDVHRAKIRALCTKRMFDAIDAGERKDTAEILAQLAGVTADIAATTAEIAKEQRR
jgi:hypothetical protein